MENSNESPKSTFKVLDKSELKQLYGGVAVPNFLEFQTRAKVCKSDK
jgi:hypothetical protein